MSYEVPSTDASAASAIFLAILGNLERFWQQFEADLQVLALKNRCSSSKTGVSTGVSTGVTNT